METNLIFKKAAKMLLENGYRVIAWENDSYTQKWRKGDFVSVHFGKDGEKRVGYISFDSFGGPIRFGLEYIPSKNNGSGCLVFEGGEITMDEINKLMNSTYPGFVRGVEEYEGFESYAKEKLKFYDFMHEVTREELEGI